MKNYKQYIFAGLTLLSLSLTSCDDFLDTAPNDALTPLEDVEDGERRQ